MAWNTWTGSEALAFDAYDAAWQQEQVAGPVFLAHEGGHLDEAARRGVSQDFLRAVRTVLGLAVAACLICAVYLTFTAEGVKLHHANAHAQQAIEQTQLNNDELRLACEKLTRTDRISRIATQNLEMEYAVEADQLQVR